MVGCEAWSRSGEFHQADDLGKGRRAEAEIQFFDAGVQNDRGTQGGQLVAAHFEKPRILKTQVRASEPLEANTFSESTLHLRRASSSEGNSGA